MLIIFYTFSVAYFVGYNISCGCCNCKCCKSKLEIAKEFFEAETKSFSDEIKTKFNLADEDINPLTSLIVNDEVIKLIIDNEGNTERKKTNNIFKKISSNSAKIKKKFNNSLILQKLVMCQEINYQIDVTIEVNKDKLHFLGNIGPNIYLYEYENFIKKNKQDELKYS